MKMAYVGLALLNMAAPAQPFSAAAIRGVLHQSRPGAATAAASFASSRATDAPPFAHQGRAGQDAGQRRRRPRSASGGRSSGQRRRRVTASAGALQDAEGGAPFVGDHRLEGQSASRRLGVPDGVMAVYKPQGWR